MEHTVMSEIGDRSYNADCVMASPQRGIFIIADGAGTSPQAKKASEAAAHYAYSILSSNGKAPKDLILSAMHEANKIYDDIPGTSTTLDILVIDGLIATIGHIGDSRIYVVRAGDVYQLTKDHADALGYVEKMIGTDIIEPDILDSYILRTGDLIAMTTDGLHKTIGKHDMRELLAKNEPLEQKKQRMLLQIKDAMESGLYVPQDNYSAILIRC